MKDKKGFTLVELLAVIAILAIIVLLTLPNVLKIFNEAKKSSFVTEVQEIAKISTTKFIQESLKGNKVNKISSNGENKLNLSGGDVDYYIELDNKGKITYLEVTNDSFCLHTDKDYKGITKEDVTEGRCESTKGQIAMIQSMQSTTDTLDKTKFRNFVVSNSPTEIYFLITGHEGGIDISANTTDTEPIYAWMEENKMYVSARDANKRITLPSDSSFIFSGLDELDDDIQIEAFLQLSKIDAKYLNTSSVTNMLSMFGDAGFKATTFNLDLSNWNTSNVINMSGMFANAGYKSKTFNLDLSNWDTSNVTNMSRMFASVGFNATTFNLDLSNFDTSSVTNMSSMFASVGLMATNFSIKIKNNEVNTTSKLFGSDSVYAAAPSNKLFTLVDQD